ncbi:MULTISPECIES: DNA ligase [unclassified Campylobacter]|uniref:DNA ligase n=1 Tax=unclassified Campylobacter TaxID=2593542 RepID=UPI0022E9F928|nr:MULTISPECIES: DNA ligase [unclassified Campylobacter]MDA3054219.1 DNA ligase [Campylobacter sp. VBCF_07 NA4]MDA3060910.1 DNA ligase [Campylobacter sp. VBCF_02 NA5]MDA3070423.1 DNA ligase [Campylobacter sp. VBCF_08 NA3]
MNKFAKTLFCIFLFFANLAFGDEFRPMLLKEYKKGMDISGWVVSEKLDGIRAVWDGKTLRSRKGKIINAPESWTKGFPNFMIEGELWSRRGEFEKIASIVSKGSSDERWSEIKFYIFDMPNERKNLFEKMKILSNFIEKNGVQNLVVIPQTPVSSHEQIEEMLNLVVENGGEGLVIRNPYALYESGRSANILKYKKMRDSECKITHINPGYGKNKGKMGSVTCVDIKSGVKFKIGSGWSDEWRAKPPKIGTIITYQYQNLTSEKKPRFPTFLRLKPAI